MGALIFNGVSSRDLGIEVEHLLDYPVPERDTSKVHIPGRNGDLIVDHGSFKNIKRSYQVSFPFNRGDQSLIMSKIANWLYSSVGYARLEDTYDPECYRLASYSKATTIQNLFNQAGRFTIEFDCKPQRFLKLGERMIHSKEKRLTLSNPTSFEAYPLIVMMGSGSGTMIVKRKSVGISNLDKPIFFDTELQEAFGFYDLTNNPDEVEKRISSKVRSSRTLVNRNKDIELDNFTDFPPLVPGLNYIRLSGQFTDIFVVPRWWTI